MKDRYDENGHDKPSYLTRVTSPISQGDSDWAEGLGIKCHHPDGVENCGCPHYSDPKNNPVCRYATDRQADIEVQRKALETELAELQAKNEAATSWGAAVGARSERIKGLQSALRRLDPAPEPGPAAQGSQESREKEITRLACEAIANDEFERQLKIISDATDDKALSDTGRASIRAIADACALTAQRIASRIRALSLPSADGGTAA